MKYLITLTSGSYSDFTIDGYLMGDFDPTPLLDEETARMTNGRARSFKTINGALTPCPKDITMGERDAMLDRVYRSVVPLLKSRGFVETEAIELWTGER